MKRGVYAPAAEFYDVLALKFVEPLREALQTALVGADARAGPVVDIGAGTGLSTAMVANLVPDAHILAIEPSPSLRAILMSRIAASGDLRTHVSVLPTTFRESIGCLPAQIAGAVALGSLGHLRVGERRRLWNFLGKALGPGCSAVVQLLPPARPATQPLTRYAAESIGQRVYEGWSAAEPNGRRSMRWTMTYRILENGRVVDERTIRQDYLTLGRDDVAAEAGAAGLECDAVAAAGLVRIMRALGAQTRNESVTRHRR